MEQEQINIVELITQTINTIFSEFLSSIDNSLYSILDELTFISENILDNSYLEKILGSSTSNSIILIANALLIGFLLYYGISLLLSHLTFSRNEHPIQFIFKIIIFGILINSSYFFIKQIIFFNSTISLAILDIGENLFDEEISFSSLIENLNSIIYEEDQNFNVFSIYGIIRSFISFGMLNLLFSYSLRYIMIKVFIVITPFAILTLISEKTSWFFKSWFRTFLSLLFLQDLVAIILLITFSIDFSESDLFSNLMYVRFYLCFNTF